MMENLALLPQEDSTGATFNRPIYLTQGFRNTFGYSSFVIAAATVNKIREERVPLGADYLQVAKYNDTKFWVIDDGQAVTCLLPEEY